MKYIDLYSQFRPGKDEKFGIICVPNFMPCSICGRPTCYAEINYEGYFCSEECLEKFENEYYKIKSEE